MSESSGLEKFRADRLKTREAMLKDEQAPYADQFEKDTSCQEAFRADEGRPVRVAGRLMSLRDMGKTMFGHIQDESGRVQVMFRRNDMEEGAFAAFKASVDVGDFIGCVGETFKTRSQEPSVRAGSVRVLSKSLRPLPDKHHGLTDDATRFEKRYLDILTSEAVRERFRTRSRVISLLRHLLDEHGFLEVETPQLQMLVSGANARAFETRHNALDRPLVLRIAPETYLKRLMVAGYERVYEIGKNFRNEGMDRSHLQEFTMLEYYAAWWNMWDNVRFIQGLLARIVQDVHGGLEVSYGDQVLDFGGEWRVVEYRDLVQEDCGIDVLAHDSAESLISEIQHRGIDVGDLSGAGFGTVIDKLYKKVSRPKLVQPTFLTHHPACLLPLARPNDKDPRVVDAFQVLVNGWEIVKAYSELIDPVIQREKFEEQVHAKEAGDDEAMPLDEPYLEAMEYGMPPNSGLGLGIDRLVALLTNQTSLKEAVIFPIGT